MKIPCPICQTNSFGRPAWCITCGSSGVIEKEIDLDDVCGKVKPISSRKFYTKVIIESESRA